MGEIKKIFDEIAEEGGSNAKMDILRKYKDNELLERVLYLANSKRVKFYIKQIPEYESGTLYNMSVNNLNIIAATLSDRVETGHAAIAFLKSWLESFDADDAYILERIIEKDCKIGMGTSNINKVFPNLIEKTPYMGAKSFSEKLARKIFEDGPAHSQVKMDGRYANAIIRHGEVELLSRQGETTHVGDAKFLEELSRFDDCVLNGELTIDGYDRYTANGMVASIVDIEGKRESRTEKETEKKIANFEKKHCPYDEAIQGIRYTVWDRIEIEEYFNKKSTMEYSTRFRLLVAKIHRYDATMVSLIELKSITTYEEAMEHFQSVLHRGLEGTILKSTVGAWKDGKPNWQVKMKLEMDVDLKIVGFNYGTKGTKNEHVISSLQAETSCGKLFTQPQGLKEDEMTYVTENQDALLGTIVEVKSCGLSHDSDGNYSLLHPAFTKFRDDKDTCDSLESIMEIEAMAKGLKEVK